MENALQYAAWVIPPYITLKIDVAAQYTMAIHFGWKTEENTRETTLLATDPDPLPPGRE